MLTITFPNGSIIRLEYTGESVSGGQHGNLLVFQEWNAPRKFLLKPFYCVIDQKTPQLDSLHFDLSWDAAKCKQHGQFERIANELVASKLANHYLKIRVPFCFPIVSFDVANFEISPGDFLPFEPEIKFVDGLKDPVTFKEFYGLKEWDIMKVETTNEFDDILLSQQPEKRLPDPSFAIGFFSEYIPNAIDVDTAMCRASEDGCLDEWMEKLRKNRSGIELLPFDTWVNDPDRNSRNYLLQELNGENKIWGIDYELFSFSGNLPDDTDSTNGRSYLAAILHNETSVNDPLILHEVSKIRMLSKESIKEATRLPSLLIQYVEYHIANGNLSLAARNQIKLVEQNLLFYLWETKPKLSRLETVLERQLGISPLETLLQSQIGVQQ
ncbi:MAG: hypothetical protein ACFFGZ_17560 [Candidatus Thorarchaeota archaeon]